MNARQGELRGIPQFDSGRWKLRLEFARVDADYGTTMGMDFDSAAQAVGNNITEVHSLPLPIERVSRGR